MAKITERFPATVTGNDDDEQRGRIRVACAGLMGDEESDLPMWVEPCHDWGWFYVPDVGEIVEVEVVAGTELDEHFGQASIDNLDIRWRSKRFYTTAEGSVGDAPQDPAVDARLVHDELKTNYGKRRGFATPWGHVIIFDDTEGDHRIAITHAAEKLPPGEAFADETKYSRIEIEPDGSLKASLIGKHTIHVQTVGNKLEASLDSGQHVLTLDGTVPSFDVSLGGGAGINVAQSDADAVTNLGDGAEAAVIASELKDWLDNTFTPAVADMHDNHYHPLPLYIAPLHPGSPTPTTAGVSGDASQTPIVAASLESYDDAITSQKLFFPAN